MGDAIMKSTSINRTESKLFNETEGKILYGNCSEATMRLNVTDLSDEMIKKVLNVLAEIEKEHSAEFKKENESKKDGESVEVGDDDWWYDTWFGVEQMFRMRVITIKGEVPYNSYDNLIEALGKKLGLVTTVEDSAEFNTRVDLLTNGKPNGKKHVSANLSQILDDIQYSE